MASDLEGFVDALGLGRFVLVGHSMGGMVGMAYSARHGDHVERLVLGDIGPEISDAWSSDWGARPPEPLEFDTFEDVVLHIQRTDRVNAWHASEEGLRRGLADVVRQRDDGVWVWRADPALFRGAFGRSGIDLWQSYRSVTSPTLLVRGSESVLISSAILERMRDANSKLTSVDLPGAGHMLHEDQPEAFLAVVQDWLEESSSP